MLNVGEYTPEEIEKIRQANEDHYLEGQHDEDEEIDGDESEFDPEE